MGKKKNTTLTMPKKTAVTVSKKSSATTPTLTAIKDLDAPHNQGIILINQNTMQEVFTKSGPHAAANEFQTHFWSVNYRFQAQDGSILDIAIPTVHFNYEQEVTSSHIDFELKDVSKISAAVKPIHDMKVNELEKTNFLSSLTSILGTPLIQWDVPLNSIHRHPGSMHTFSGTDLCKTASEPGVCYPLNEPTTDQPNFAGIMTIHSGKCSVGHFEHRIANGKLGTDLTYQKSRCATLVVDSSTQTSMVEQLFGITPKSLSYAKFDNCSSNSITDAIHVLAHELYQTHNFAAFTDSVVPEHVKKKTYVATTYGTSYNYHQNAYQEREKKKMETYIHKFENYKALTAPVAYSINETRKKLEYKKTGKLDNTWVTPVSKAVDQLMALQKELGYTTDAPYGPNGYPIFSLDTYEDMYLIDLRKTLTSAIEFYKFEVKEDLDSMLKPALMACADALIKAHGPKPSEETPPELTLLSEVAVVNLTKAELKGYISKLEKAYYVDCLGVEQYVDTEDEYDHEDLKDLRRIALEYIDWIEEEMSTVLGDSKEDTEEPRDTLLELTPKQIMEELGALGCDMTLVETLSDDQLKNFYAKHFL